MHMPYIIVCITLEFHVRNSRAHDAVNVPVYTLLLLYCVGLYRLM
jgi:hypothetical protein